MNDLIIYKKNELTLYVNVGIIQKAFDELVTSFIEFVKVIAQLTSEELKEMLEAQKVIVTIEEEKTLKDKIDLLNIDLVYEREERREELKELKRASLHSKPIKPVKQYYKVKPHNKKTM